MRKNAHQRSCWDRENLIKVQNIEASNTAPAGCPGIISTGIWKVSWLNRSWGQENGVCTNCFLPCGVEIMSNEYCSAAEVDGYSTFIRVFHGLLSCSLCGIGWATKSAMVFNWITSIQNILDSFERRKLIWLSICRDSLSNSQPILKHVGSSKYLPPLPLSSRLDPKELKDST